ncbi:MAG: hypothetical protein AAF322_14155 [Pseudomonadota bacterium]
MATIEAMIGCGADAAPERGAASGLVDHAPPRQIGNGHQGAGRGKVFGASADRKADLAHPPPDQRVTHRIADPHRDVRISFRHVRLLGAEPKLDLYPGTARRERLQARRSGRHREALRDGDDDLALEPVVAASDLVADRLGFSRDPAHALDRASAAVGELGARRGACDQPRHERALQLADLAADRRRAFAQRFRRRGDAAMARDAEEAPETVPVLAGAGRDARRCRGPRRPLSRRAIRERAQLRRRRGCLIGLSQSRTPAPGGGADFARGDLGALGPIPLSAQVDLLEADLTASPSDIPEALLRNVSASFFRRLSDLNGILLAATTPAGVDEVVAAAGSAAAVSGIVDRARRLVQIGVDEVVVQTPPLLSFFPDSAPLAALLAASQALNALTAPCGHRRIAQKLRSRSPWRPFARPAALLGRQRQGRRMKPPSAECSPSRDSLEHRQLR